MEKPLAHDFKEFLSLLNSAMIEYLVVGGYAVNYYGVVRSTGDLDIWIAVHPANVERVVSVLKAFGLGAANPTVEMLTKPGALIRMGVPPVRVEVLTAISGVEFAACYARRTQAELGGVPVPMIHIDDLLRNKTAAGRPKDMADVQEIVRRIKGGR